MNVVRFTSRTFEGLGFDRITTYLDRRHRRKWWLRQLPNTLSASRMVVAPVGYYYLLPRLRKRQDRLAAVIALLLIGEIGISDYWDGEIARRCKAVSWLGAMLDPLFDKLSGGALLRFYLVGMKERVGNQQYKKLHRAVTVQMWLDGLLVGFACTGAVMGLKGRANHFGKVKFGLIVASLTAGFGSLAIGEDREAAAQRSVAIVTVGEVTASVFAVLSLIEHLRRPEG